MLLTGGWDCPIVDCIVVLRPTKVRSLYCQMVGRGTRRYPGKDHLLILDFLWLTGKHNLIHPADIVCKKQEVAEKVTKQLEEGSEVDLFEAEEKAEKDVLTERKNALEKALKEAEAQRKKKKLIDPLEYELSINKDDLIDYVPTFGWEIAPATDKQKSTIEKFGIDAEGMSKGQASKLIDNLMSRVGMSTPKQIKLLNRYGFRNVQDWTIDEAKKMIAQLAAANWQVWKCRIEPAFYQPERLRGNSIEWT